jgi:hypothetical protein
MRKFSQILLLFVLALSLTSQVTAQDNMSGPNVIVMLTPTPLAENAGLEGVTGWAHVNSPEGTLHIVLEPNGAMLPEGTVLEGWLVDAGLNGGPGMTNVTDDDEAYGTPFGNAEFDAAVESAPYALSTGVLSDDMGMLTLTFHVPAYNFSPYDAVVITLESDGNTIEGFDPRPGTPVLAGEIMMGEMMEDEMMMEDATSCSIES